MDDHEGFVIKESSDFDNVGVIDSVVGGEVWSPHDGAVARTMMIKFTPVDFAAETSGEQQQWVFIFPDVHDLAKYWHELGEAILNEETWARVEAVLHD